eukprot:TCALIF_11486-PA protein Name:"Similar to YAL004W Putative uncharacterized protein YAL004W (Saccharomyces cerevisiae (strain ATCC 204508 / S288c))" AED:0.44 eAED:0.44 QI:0/0/0/0.4/1/1/5/0/281
MHESAFVVGDGNLLLLAGGFVHGRHVQDPVGINVEGDLNLWHASRRWRDSGEVEPAQKMIILGHGSLALKYLDGDRRGITRQDSRLYGRTIGYSFIWIDALVQLSAIEEVLQQLLNLGNPRGSTHQNDIMDGGLVHFGISQGFLHRLQSASEKVGTELFKSSSVRISSGGLNFKHSILNGQDGDVKSPAPQIEDQHVTLSSLALLLVQPVGNGRGSRFIDDPQHFQSGNGSGIFGGLSLRIVEIGGNCHHGVPDRGPQISFSRFLHLAPDLKLNPEETKVF